jgi:nucleoside-diphosphate-sugar epimerase
MTLESPVCAITGATGYVGSRIAEAVRRQAQVVALTRRPASNAEIAWTLTGKDDIAPLLLRHKVTTLVHAAWDFRAVSKEQIWRVNVEGSIRLFQMAKEAGIRRIVFISTISAFTGARSHYGKSKLEVEAAAARLGGVILRPGLVFGESPGGVFGSIRRQVRNGRFVPLIGSGRAPQFLVPEATLAGIVADAVAGRFDTAAGQPITIANPAPYPFRDLVRSIARTEKRNATLVPLPWQLLYAGLRLGEKLGKELPFRSDSVISFIYQNPAPDFSALEGFGISVPGYAG